MAAALEAKLQVTAALIQGSGGIFEVAVDGRVVSQRQLGNFPEEDEVVKAVAAALGRT